MLYLLYFGSIKITKIIFIICFLYYFFRKENSRYIEAVGGVM